MKLNIIKNMGLNNKTYMILALAAVITVSATLSAYWLINTMPIYDIKEFEMEVYVDSVSGFNVDKDAIRFGVIPPGSVGERRIKIVAGEFKTRVTVEYAGEIAEWVSVSKNNFILEPFEEMMLTVYVMIPEDIVPLDYKQGTMRIIFRKT